MKKEIGVAGIAVGVCVLIVLVIVLYRVFLPAPQAITPQGGFQRPGPPPGHEQPGQNNAPTHP